MNDTVGAFSAKVSRATVVNDVICPRKKGADTFLPSKSVVSMGPSDPAAPTVMTRRRLVACWRRGRRFRMKRMRAK